MKRIVERTSREVVLHSKEYACEHTLLSWWHLLSTFTIIGFLSVLSILGESLLVKLSASFLLGLVLVRGFILYHDCEHGTIFRGSRLARYGLWMYGLLMLNPASIWRRSHDHHHRNNAKIYGASIGSFPVMTRERYSRASKGERAIYAISRHPLTIATAYLTVFLWGMCLRSLLSNPKLHWDSALAIALHGSLVVGVMLIDPAAALYLIVTPMAISTALGAYLFYAQHNFPAVKLRDRQDWDYYFAARNSSSYIQMGPILNWLTGNIGYHHVHHLNAHIPFYRLPEAMAGIEELQDPGVTSLAVRDIWRCFRLKLWDSELNRMVPFR